jgi:hypothetical protein
MENKELKYMMYPHIYLKNMLEYDGKIIGFIANGLYFYCKNADKENVKYPVVKLLYNPVEINTMISDIRSGKLSLEYDEELNQKLQYCLYNYYLYSILILQFISYFNKQKNTELRKKLIKTIEATDFSKDTTDIKKILGSIADNEDLIKIKKFIYNYITISHNKVELIKDIQESYFNFDRIQLEELKNLPYTQAKKRLMDISKNIIKFGNVDAKKGFKIPNILVSCAEKHESVDYCDSDKFIMTREKHEELISILAYDITNSLKWKWLFNSIFIEKIIDYFLFRQRPNEKITIEFET